jgi:hypothetical protein
MKETRVTLPELSLIGGTRVALGAGLGLLLADRLTADQRRAVGWTLLLIGVLSTIPLAIEILAKSHADTLWEGQGRSLGESWRANERVGQQIEPAHS